MAIARWEDRQTASENKTHYEPSFVDRVHRILRMGYQRLKGADFVTCEEEAITGELTRAMQEAVEDPGAPPWAKYFWPSDEPRIHAEGRLGKRRRRLDIEIRQHGVSLRPRFAFEAKRLHDARSRREYLGADGLGCFLDGRYATHDAIAGMLGYVQEHSVEHQAAGLGEALRADRKKHQVREGGEWTACPVVDSLSTYRSRHDRACGLPPITLLHTLLLCR